MSSFKVLNVCNLSVEYFRHARYRGNVDAANDKAIIDMAQMTLAGEDLQTVRLPAMQVEDYPVV